MVSTGSKTDIVKSDILTKNITSYFLTFLLYLSSKNAADDKSVTFPSIISPLVNLKAGLCSLQRTHKLRYLERNVNGYAKSIPQNPEARKNGQF